MEEIVLFLTRRNSNDCFFIELPTDNNSITTELEDNDSSALYQIRDFNTNRILHDNIKLSDLFRINSIYKRMIELNETELEIVELLANLKAPSIESYEDALRNYYAYELLDGTDIELVGKHILENIIHTDLHNGKLKHAVNVFAIGKEAFNTQLAIPVSNNRTLLKFLDID